MSRPGTSPRHASPLGVGIIGCGNISAAYLRLAPLFATIQMRAVADISPAAAEKRAEEFGVEAQSVAALLQNPDIDIVLNLTTPDAHFAVSREALHSGKHVYSEKPLALSLEQGQELIRLSARSGKLLCSAPDTFLGGAHQQARRILDEGEIGEIVGGTCHFMSPGMEDWHPDPGFFFQPGGGPVLDMGPYYITGLLNLLGPVVRVSAMGATPQKVRTIGSGQRAGEKLPVAVFTSVHAIMEFENGALVTLATSWDVKAHDHSPMELYGSEGSLFLPDPNFFAGDLRRAGADGTISDIEGWAHPLGVENQDDGGAMIANYRSAGLADMAAAINGGREPRCSAQLALHGLDVMLAILRAAETGQVQELQTSCRRPAPLGAQEAQELMA